MNDFIGKLNNPMQELYSEITTKGNPFCFPFIYSGSNGDFFDYIVSLINAYVERVNMLDSHSINLLNSAFDGLPQEKKPVKDFDFLRDLYAISSMVVDVITDCYRCYPDDAFQKLKRIFEDNDCFYLNMIPHLEIKNGIFYRIRTGVFDKSKDGELFHIPFDKRHLVSSQRYSIPGYPILYLAGSLFTAWCELDKPELVEINCVGYTFKDKAYFLDLGFPYGKSTVWELYSLFVMYPLLMACMVRVKNPSAPFKPEYIMPQLMTKLVREHGKQFLGIAYMSNKLPDSCPINSLDSRNFAVCTYNCICSKGHDKDLADRMQMTDIIKITKDEIQNAVLFSNNKYSIDFRILEKKVGRSFRDINVMME